MSIGQPSTINHVFNPVPIVSIDTLKNKDTDKSKNTNPNPVVIRVRHQELGMITQEPLMLRLRHDASLSRLGLLNERKEPDIDKIKAMFLRCDPTQEKKYLTWILEGYRDGGNHLLEDMMAQIPEALSKFIRIKPLILEHQEDPNILNYCGYFGCQQKMLFPPVNKGKRSKPQGLNVFMRMTM